MKACRNKAILEKNFLTCFVHVPCTALPSIPREGKIDKVSLRKALVRNTVNKDSEARTDVVGQGVSRCNTIDVVEVIALSYALRRSRLLVVTQRHRSRRLKVGVGAARPTLLVSTTRGKTARTGRTNQYPLAVGGERGLLHAF